MGSVNLKLTPKRRIMRAAAEEFATHGFAAVSIKQIACKAAVNVAMISYYFGGKTQLLDTIIRRFFARMQLEIKGAINANDSFETNAMRLSGRLIDFFKEYPQACRLCIFGINHQMPELSQLKSQKLGELYATTRDLMSTCKSTPLASPEMVNILATAFGVKVAP